MQHTKRIILPGCIGLLLAVAGSSQAQDLTAPKSAPVVAAVQLDLNKKADALRVQEMPLREVAAKLAAQTGVQILVDTATGSKPVTLDFAGGTLAEVMKQVATQVGQGAVVRFVALPVQEPMPTGDAIMQALVAQDALKPLRVAGADSADPNAPRKPKRPVAAVPEQTIVAPETTTEPTIEIAGRAVTFEKAAPLVGMLNLRPVYVVMNPLGDNLVAKSARLQSEGLQVWLGMTADQRKQAMETQLNGILSMDPSTRRALFGQMMEQGQGMMQKIMSLPAEQRKAFFSDLTGGKFDGSQLPSTPPTPPSGGN